MALESRTLAQLEQSLRLSDPVYYRGGVGGLPLVFTIEDGPTFFGINFDELFDPATGLIRNSALPISIITATNSALTLDNTHFAVICDASGGAFTITLPAASGATGRAYHIKKVDSSGNPVTVDGNANETIDGDPTKIINTQYDSMMIICDGSNWHII